MFDQLIGNEKIKQDLRKAIQTGKVSHSYLLIGNKGIGKMLFAKEFAKAILCENKESKPCMHCTSCTSFENGNHPDFYTVSLEEKENSIKIDTIRALQSKVQELPIRSKRKVYIIDDSEFMTKEAQNCLLKTIEEPPAFVTILLVTSNENKILNTIQSRCLKIHFQPIEENQLKNYLEEHYHRKDISENQLKAFNGSIGKALQMEENREIYHTIETVFNHIENYTLSKAMKALEVLYKEKELIYEMLDYSNVIFLNKAKQNKKYLSYIKKVEEIKRNINANCNYDMSIDSLLFEIWK